MTADMFSTMVHLCLFMKELSLAAPFSEMKGAGMETSPFHSDLAFHIRASLQIASTYITIYLHMEKYLTYSLYCQF
jgi:hypothetical protein